MTDPSGDVVLVAYLHPNTVSQSFSDSLMRLVAWDVGHEGRVIRSGGPVMFRAGPGGLAEARNEVLRHFLDDSGADWLWMVDADMGFAADTVDRLVAAADPGERPVVGALCFGLREVAADGMGGWKVRGFPTLYDWAQNAEGTFGFHVRRGYTPDVVTQVAGTGAACLLVHRTAGEKVRADSGDEWFAPVQFTDGRPVSEDLSFCYRLNKAGVPVFVHTGVKTTHHKQFWLGEDLYRLLETQYQHAAGAEPASL